MGDLDADPIMHLRDLPTIIDMFDPVQLLIPAPVLSNVNRSKVVESLAEDKAKTVSILAEILESSLDLMKNFEDGLIGAKIEPKEV